MAAEQSPSMTTHTLAELQGYLTSLAESHGQQEVVQLVCETAARLLPMSRGNIWQAALDREGWQHAGAWAEGRVLPLTDAPAQAAPPRGPEDELRIPLHAQGLAVGELRADMNSLRNADEHALLASLATAAAISLSGHQLQRRVRHRNVRDPLTGLFNRRYLEDTLERELHRARRVGASLVLIRLEVDAMADFTAEHGPETSDRLFQGMADAVHRSFRGSDVCCRASDQGFGILLPDAGLENGSMRAEAVREEIGELRVHQRGRALGPLTVSAGIAAFPEHGANSEFILEAAESAVTRARDEGGDVTRSAERVNSTTSN